MNIKINSLKSRRGLFLAFAFAMTATLSFLAIYNMTKTNAASFNAGDIMSDAVMANYNSMSEADINNFMHSKNSCNDTNLSKRNKYPNLTYQIRDGHFVCLADQTFNGQSAAHIIWQAAQDYKINPQVLLVLLQKEQSLITDTWPDDQQIRKATGFACTDSAPCDQSKSGFENQIRKAANLYRTVLDGGWSNYPVGNNYVQYNPNTGCGGSTIYIANRATSSLYRYTPYQPNAAALNGGGDSCSAYGNLNFWKYFTNWFGDTHAISDINSVYMPEGTYILNTTAGKALGFSGTSNGTAAKVVDSNNSDTSQQFTLERDDYQYFKLRNVASGRYLDVNGANTANGTQVQLWDGNDTCAQKWSIEIVNEKSYKLRNACSYKALDISGAAVGSTGTKIQIWEDNSTNAQRWDLTNINSNPINPGTYNLVTVGGRALALTNEGLANSTAAITGELHPATTEQFQITRGQDGNYYLKHVASGRYLDVKGANVNNGSVVQIYDRNNSCSQRWGIQKNSNGYRLTSACSGKSLDVSGDRVKDYDVKIEIWANNSSTAQVWQFTEPSQPQPISEGLYTIQSAVGSSLFLDAAGGTPAHDGTNIHIWNKNSTDSQKFWVSYDSNRGYYTIKNFFAMRNLDVSGASVRVGTNVQTWSVNDSCSQKWILTSTSNGRHKLLSACSRLALDVKGGNASQGVNVQVWSNNNSAAQEWVFQRLDENIVSDGRILDDGLYTIQSAVGSSLFLDAAGGTPAHDGTNIHIWNKNSTDSQKFWVSYNRYGNYYNLKSIFANRNVDVSGAVALNRTNVQAWTANLSCAQKWQITKVDDKYHRLSSLCNGNYSLDVSGATPIQGTNVQTWQNNTSAAQKWKFIKQES